MNRERFWLVACGGISIFRYSTHAEAVAEAKRLALRSTGTVYHVLASVEAYVKSDVERIEFPEDYTQSTLPF